MCLPRKPIKSPSIALINPLSNCGGSWIISIDTISICILCCDSWNSIWLLVSDRIRTSLPNIIPNPTTSTFHLHILSVYQESGMASARFTKDFNLIDPWNYSSGTLDWNHSQIWHCYGTLFGLLPLTTKEWSRRGLFLILLDEMYKREFAGTIIMIPHLLLKTLF